MKKTFWLVTLCLAGIKVSFAQHFSHGVGLGYSAEFADNIKTRTSTIITYSPRINVSETENTSVSVGMPLSIGISNTFKAGYSLNSDSAYDYGYSTGFILNVPVMVNFNIGAGSVPGNQKRTGFFAGAGYAYNLSTVNTFTPNEYGPQYEFSRKETKGNSGPAANLGVRIGVGSLRRRHNIEIKTSYMRAISSRKLNVIGLNCLFNF